MGTLADCPGSPSVILKAAFTQYNQKKVTEDLYENVSLKPLTSTAIKLTSPAGPSARA
jgi:hypothetical protein